MSVPRVLVDVGSDLVYAGERVKQQQALQEYPMSECDICVDGAKDLPSWRE